MSPARDSTLAAKTRVAIGERPPRRRKRNDLIPALLFLLPNLFGFALFTVGPVGFSLLASFTDWNLTQPKVRWVALENFGGMLGNHAFWVYLVNTLYFMLGMPIAIVGSLALALLLNQKARGLVAFRTLLYLPSFTAGVALMILWKALYNPDFGPINYAIGAALDLLGLARDVSLPQWLNATQNMLGIDPETVRFSRAQVGLGARDALLWMGVWTAVGGGNMLLYLAALANVPEELTEAAELDGAGSWAKFRSVVWPQLAPTTFFIVVMSCIGGFQGGFDQARIMTNGGPAGTTTTLAFHIYQKAFEEFQMGYASAVSWALFALVFLVTVANWRFGNRAGDWE
ncbi:MAG TPA: sugar ABC transporter permease [Fimbriimonas sp.]